MLTIWVLSSALHVVDHASDQHVAVHTLNIHPRVGNMTLNQLMKAGHVGFDIDFKVQQLVSVTIEDEGICLAVLHTAKDDPLGRLHDSISDCRVRDDDIRGWIFEIDDERLVEPECYLLRHVGLPGRGDDRSHVIGRRMRETRPENRDGQ